MATQNPDQNAERELPAEVVRDLLSVDRRRRALQILRRRDRPVVVADLAAAILAVERETSEESIDEADKNAVREELYREHLPKLTATGVVDYDSMTGTVALRRPEVLPGVE